MVYCLLFVIKYHNQKLLADHFILGYGSRRESKMAGGSMSAVCQSRKLADQISMKIQEAEWSF